LQTSTSRIGRRDGLAILAKAFRPGTDVRGWPANPGSRSWFAGIRNFLLFLRLFL